MDNINYKTKNEAETVFNQTVSDAFSISIVVQNDQPIVERIIVEKIVKSLYVLIWLIDLQQTYLLHTFWATKFN